LDKIIWNKYFGEWEKLSYEGALLISKFKKSAIDDILELNEEERNYKGLEKERIVKSRVSQSDFRKRILASYNEKCCITGINITALLVASHIVPWSVDPNNRLNPKNGLCLNYLHDKAFDRGLITIDKNCKVLISNKVLKRKNENSIQSFFIKYQKQEIQLPDRYAPDSKFLKWHYDNIFDNSNSI